MYMNLKVNKTAYNIFNIKHSIMKKLIITILALMFLINFAHAQGCIIVRNITGLGQYNLTTNSFTNSNWQLTINTRYFKAYHDFKGSTDLKTPPANQNVIKSFSTDFDVTHFFNKGWSIDVSLPISANSRTSDLEHGGLNTPRYTTHSFGAGDLQLTVFKWLLPIHTDEKGNMQLGLGIKLPTGDYRYQDYFHWDDTTKVLAPVNASIQLGDGGTGIVTQFNTFYFFGKHLNFYGDFYYLINPREQNGVPATLGGRPISANVIKAGGDMVSVPDIYSLRAGFNLNVDNWAFSAGIRDEGSPVHDLLGNSLGSRRAGYTLSAEPGLVYKFKRTTLYTYVPFTVSHAIRQNLVDKNLTKLTGEYTLSAGGSGDYQIFVGIQFLL